MSYWLLLLAIATCTKLQIIYNYESSTLNYECAYLTYMYIYNHIMHCTIASNFSNVFITTQLLKCNVVLYINSATQ